MLSVAINVQSVHSSLFMLVLSLPYIPFWHVKGCCSSMFRAVYNKCNLFVFAKVVTNKVNLTFFKITKKSQIALKKECQPQCGLLLFQMLELNRTLSQFRPDILPETDLLHGCPAKRIFSQEKGDHFKCSPIPCTCVAKYITAARELSTCVRINQPR